MKNFFFFALFCFGSSLYGQIIKQDTFYYPLGVISSIRFSSMADTTGQPQAERFDIKRGNVLEYTGWKLDSTKWFRKGKFTKTLLSNDLKRLARIKKYPFLKLLEGGKYKNFRKFNEQFGLIELVNIAGSVGDQIPASMTFFVVGEEDFSISLLQKPDEVTINDFKKKLPPGVHEIDLAVKLPPGVSQKMIQIAGPDQEVYNIRLALKGYDLTEVDFIPNASFSGSKHIDASGREYLFLRLESTEKLLNLYQGEKLRFRIPVGRQIDQIPVYHLPPGDYRMEVIDLGTGEKRSYGLKR